MGAAYAHIVLPGCFPTKDSGGGDRRDPIQPKSFNHEVHKRSNAASLASTLCSLSSSASSSSLSTSLSSSSCPEATVPTEMIGDLNLPNHGEGLRVIRTDGDCCILADKENAYMLAEDGVSVLWGWQFFDAGLRKALLDSKKHQILDEENRQKYRERLLLADTERAYLQSIHHHHQEQRRRLELLRVFDVSSTLDLHRKFRIFEVPGDGLCMYNSMFQGLKHLRLLRKTESFPSFLEHILQAIACIDEYKNIYAPLFSYKDLGKLNGMSSSDIEHPDVNGRIDPLVKIRGALCLSLGERCLNGKQINRQIVWGDHLELFFILKVFSVNAVIFQMGRSGEYLRTQNSVLYADRPVLYLQKSPNHYDLLLPRHQ
eukprot:jgi/Bigna1/90611/estExt_fgenesh1_pg.C_740070